MKYHFVFETLAFVVGFRYFLYLRNKQQDLISESNRIWILISATFGSLLFSRIIGALENPIELMNSENKLLYIYSNKTILGGLLGGVFAVEVMKKIIKVNSSSGDLFTFPLIVAMIIGRIGCFSMGIHEPTFGVETKFILGMNLGDGLYRHPVALYEIGFLILIFGLIKLLEKNRIFKNGIRFQFFMIFYLIFRLLIDFIKPGFHYIYSLGTIQLCSIAGLLYYYKTIAVLFIKPSNLFENDRK